MQIRQTFQKYHFVVFFILVAMESMAANFAHPITPTLIQQLQLPDYSFGLLYAGMALRISCFRHYGQIRYII